jgi:hypothetical protein
VIPTDALLVFLHDAPVLVISSHRCRCDLPSTRQGLFVLAARWSLWQIAAQRGSVGQGELERGGTFTGLTRIGSTLLDTARGRWLAEPTWSGLRVPPKQCGSW